MNPILVHLGPVAIRYYGLVYALAFIFTYVYLRYQIKQKRLRITFDQLDTLIIAIIIGVVVGGRVGEFLFWEPRVLFSTPLQIFKIWQGGMSFHGGIIGVGIAVWWFCKKYNVKFYELTDHFVIPASLALFFGRIANFINSELVGKISSVSWCVHFPKAARLESRVGCRHPSQLYEAAKNLLMFGILLSINYQQRYKKKFKDGFLTWLFVLMYGILRTVTNIWREDVEWFLGIFSTGQLLSMIMVIIAGFVLIKYYSPLFKTKKKPNKKITIEHKKISKTKNKNKNKNENNNKDNKKNNNKDKKVKKNKKNINNNKDKKDNNKKVRK